MTQSDEGQSRFFCSELSRRARERVAGTASTGAVWFLLEYPHGWGRHAFQESALPAEVKQFFKDAMARIRHSRILLIKTDRGRRDARMNLFVVCCRERSPFTIRLRVERYFDVLRYDLAEIASGRDLQGGEASRGPLYLVCTHGRRDKCCAKFGVPLYNTLRERAGDRVWQSSHVGGDRFAGNLVCFPHGLFYAHMTADAARRIMEKYEQRQLVLEGYRGRACYSYPVQAAEFFIRTETKLGALDALRYRRHERTRDGGWRVVFAGTDVLIHEAHIAARTSEFHNYITCQATEERPVIQYVLENYRAT